MEILAGLSVVGLIGAALIVAVRTLALWRRTRGLPELLLSLYLLGATVLGYPLMIASSRIPVTELWPLHMAGQVIMTIGLASLLLFTQKVFRPGASWARGFVGVSLLLLVASSVVYYLELTGGQPRPAAERIEINLLNTTPIAFAYFWTTFEALGYSRRLRLRVGLGLADAAVANRVLLWGMMTLAAGVAVVISLIGMLAGVFLSAPLVMVLSSLGIVHALCLLLAFHPPSWYAAWIERRAGAAANA